MSLAGCSNQCRKQHLLKTTSPIPSGDSKRRQRNHRRQRHHHHLRNNQRRQRQTDHRHQTDHPPPRPAVSPMERGIALSDRRMPLTLTMLTCSHALVQQTSVGDHIFQKSVNGCDNGSSKRWVFVLVFVSTHPACIAQILIKSTSSYKPIHRTQTSTCKSILTRRSELTRNTKHTQKMKSSAAYQMCFEFLFISPVSRLG